MLTTVWETENKNKNVNTLYYHTKNMSFCCIIYLESTDFNLLYILTVRQVFFSKDGD